MNYIVYCLRNMCIYKEKQILCLFDNVILFHVYIFCAILRMILPISYQHLS